MSVTLEVADGTGAVTGRFTSRGFNRGALDEPLTGTWDGTVLRFESTVKADVNTQRSGGNCGDGRIAFTLKRKPGGDAFEGESRREGSLPSEIALSP